MISRSVVLLTGPVAALTLASCSASSSGSTSRATTSTSTSTSTSASTSTGTGAKAAPAASGSVTVGAAPGSIPVIAEQKGLPVRIDTSSGFTTADSVTVGVSSLKLDPNGKTMTLRLVFTPSITSTTNPANTMSLFATGGSYPILLDRTHLKRYRVIGVGNYASDSSTTRAGNGRSMEAWFGFAAPQDDVSSLELTVNSSWPSFLNVPVEK
jgi:hypothetical protein